MKIFIIHRFSSQKKAKKQFQVLSKATSFVIQPVFMPVSLNDNWKEKAEKELQNCELVIIFEPDQCLISENAVWEIQKAKQYYKPVYRTNNISDDCGLKKIIEQEYNLVDEFQERFDCDNASFSEIFELYKIIVGTSEDLIQRRQKTNAFFITIIGSLVAIGGVFVKEDIVDQKNIWLLLFLTCSGMILCWTWRRQIDNYGKLNKGKFAVILKLEKFLPARIFDAEWIALGNGVRPEKYKSFTDSEKHVPLLFLFVFGCVTMVILWNSIPLEFISMLSNKVFASLKCLHNLQLLEVINPN